MTYLWLVKAGYGSLAEVKQMSAREVLQARGYEAFCSKYELAFLELNRT